MLRLEYVFSIKRSDMIVYRFIHKHHGLSVHFSECRISEYKKHFNQTCKRTAAKIKRRLQTLQRTCWPWSKVSSVTCKVEGLAVQSSSWNLQMAISPLSLQEARRPGSFGFQETQLTSWLWALVTWAASENSGWCGSADSSSLNTRTASSPQAVAKAPVNGHLDTSTFKSQVTD